MNSLSIDLNALRENYKIILNATNKDKTAVGAVVKSDAYGIGMEKAVNILYAEGVRIFFAASIDEALELKEILKNKIDSLIFTLHGLCGIRDQKSISIFAKLGLIPVLNSLEEIEVWQRNAKINEQKYDAILHIDTGMNRLGICKDEFNILQNKINEFDGINWLYVISHLACADELENIMTEQQLKIFLTKSKILPLTRRSLANSAGCFYDEKLHFDMVRCGAALYGVELHNKQPKMYEVMYLESKIISIHFAEKSKTVGYGAIYKCKRKTKIATIAIGYSSGLFRNISNRGYVFINNQKFPIIGRISMDLITIDITDANFEIKIGDRVEILGKNQTINEFAKFSDTIPYEILTSIGKSFNKYYIGDIKNAEKI